MRNGRAHQIGSLASPAFTSFPISTRNARLRLSASVC